MPTFVTKAYIQKCPETKEFYSSAAYLFWKGCHLMGLDTDTFYPADLSRLDLRKEHLIAGGVGTVRQAFRLLGVSEPHLDGMPPEKLLPFYGRKMWVTTMGQVRQWYDDGDSYFIKPLTEHKRFVGHVMQGTVSILQQTARLEDSFEVVASEVLPFISEYRLFIHDGEIVDSRPYTGDFRKAPDYEFAWDVVCAYTDAPVAYSLDLGVTASGETWIVEINDSFALGPYGLPASTYTHMVIDRWEEIVGSP